MIKDKEEYLNYLLTLDINELNRESSFVIDYLNNLVEVYNDLTNLLEFEIILDIRNSLNVNEPKEVRSIIQQKLRILEFFLDIEVASFFERKNDIDDKLLKNESLSKEELIEDIIFNHSLIFDINEHQSPASTNKDNNFKFLNYSWYDALKLLSEKLRDKLHIYNKDISSLEDDGVYDCANKIVLELINLTEEYVDHYLDLSLCYKGLLSEENYSILTKHGFLNKIIQIIKRHNLKSFDFTDFKHFFCDTEIVKIIDGDKQIIYSSRVPDKFLVIGFNERMSIYEINNEISKYKEECKNYDCEYLFAIDDFKLIIYLADVK